ncbi:hypothetical protein XENORESO_018330 [Xenotaenia resolanae]|uniref:Uncharacterized protein n=1 Tax=Xenotaenia resolanae TaxID=208358 RepID=A0ABV0VXY2_9TELE
MGELACELAELVREGRMTCTTAMTKLVQEGGSTVVQEQLLLRVPGCIRLASAWPDLDAARRVSELRTADRMQKGKRSVPKPQTEPRSREQQKSRSEPRREPPREAPREA